MKSVTNSFTHFHLLHRTTETLFFSLLFSLSSSHMSACSLARSTSFDVQLITSCDNWNEWRSEEKKQVIRKYKIVRWNEKKSRSDLEMWCLYSEEREKTTTTSGEIMKGKKTIDMKIGFNDHISSFSWAEHQIWFSFSIMCGHNWTIKTLLFEWKLLDERMTSRGEHIE